MRISLGGGGTDLPSYYQKHCGMVIAVAIDKYVYITLHETFDPGYIIKYSKIEHAASADGIEHPIVRETLRLFDIPDPHLEIVSHADIPAGTGLGSSSSFTVALIRALFAYQHKVASPEQLAEIACEIEINRLCEPIGKQDQYVAAYGGLNSYGFYPNPTYHPVGAVTYDSGVLNALEDNLLLLFTGYSRSASVILSEQDSMSKNDDKATTDNLNRVKEIGERIRVMLNQGKLAEFAELMNEQWKLKKERLNGASNPQIDAWYDIAMQNGAVGGKLVGAGGGGFLLFYTENRNRLRHVMVNGAGLKEVRFRFDYEGAKVVMR